MAYTLISSERSPFGRICRLYMAKHKIPFTFRALNMVDNKADAEALAKESPINKVPILVLENGLNLFDSRVILNHLMEAHRLPKLTPEQENTVSCIYSCMDVSVTLFLMKMSGYDIMAPNTYLRRQWERIPNNLEFIKSWVEGLDPKNPDHWDYPSMSLFSFLYWAERRAGTIKVSDYPNLIQFMEKFGAAPGISETSF